MHTFRSSIHTHAHPSVHLMHALEYVSPLVHAAEQLLRIGIRLNRMAKFFYYIAGNKLGWSCLLVLVCSCGKPFTFAIHLGVLAHVLTIHAFSRTEFAFICLERVECRCTNMNVYVNSIRFDLNSLKTSTNRIRCNGTHTDQHSRTTGAERMICTGISIKLHLTHNMYLIQMPSESGFGVAVSGNGETVVSSRRR